MKSCWPAFAIALAARGALAADPALSSNPARFAAGTGVFTEAQAFAGNDFVPLSQLLKDDWGAQYGPRPGTNVAVLAARWETGFYFRGFRVAYLYRQDWFGRGHQDSLDLAHADRQDRDFDAGRTYKLDYRMKGFAADGVRVGKAFSHALEGGWGIAWGVAWSGLRGHRLRLEQLDATAVGKGGRNVDAEGSWERDDSNANTVARGFAPAFVEGKAAGDGYSADVGVQLTSPGGIRFEWSAMDAIGRMYWYSIPQITLSGSTTFSGTLPSGRMVRVDLVEDLRPKQSLSVSVPVGRLRMDLADHYVEGFHFPRVGLATARGPLELRADYDVHFAALGVGVAYGWLRIAFMTDALRLDSARTASLDLSLRIPL